jgi:hypothetical protein
VKPYCGILSLISKAPSLCHGSVEQNEDDRAAGVACLARLPGLGRAEDFVGAEREDEIVADVVQRTG